jgi:hypothetical protein
MKEGEDWMKARQPMRQQATAWPEEEREDKCCLDIRERDR